MFAFCIVIFDVARVSAATYYVGKVATGDESGSNRDNVMLLATFQDTVAQPGDTALLQLTADHTPYGDWTINPRDGTNPGTAGHWITYQADPGTVTPMPSDWLTREADVGPPDPNLHVVFGKITFGKNYQGEDYNDTGDFYIRVDGIRTTGLLYFDTCAAWIVVQNSVIRQETTDYAWSNPSDTLFFRHYYGSGSEFHNIRIHNCYVSGGGRIVHVAGRITDGPVTISHCRLTNCQGSFITNGSWNNEGLGGLVIHHCRIDHLEQIGNNTEASYITVRNIVAVDANEPRRIFQMDGDIPAGNADLVDFEHNGVGDLGIKGEGLEIQRIHGDVNHVTYWVTLPQAVTFDFNTAGDQVRGMDDAHGSGFAIYADNLTVTESAIHDIGATAGVFIYKNGAGLHPPDANGAKNITFDDNCLYLPLNTTWQWSFSTYDKLGNNFRFRHNTVAGVANPDDAARPWLYYGRLQITANANTDRSTWDVSNNLLACTIVGSLADANTCGNLVYAHVTTEAPYSPANQLRTDDVDPNNRRNILIYAGQGVGSEPQTFKAAGGVFLATDPNFDQVYAAGYTGDLLASLHIKASGPAWNTGDPNHSTPADIDGQTRTGLPDIGCDEIASTIKKVWGFKK